MTLLALHWHILAIYLYILQKSSNFALKKNILTNIGKNKLVNSDYNTRLQQGSHYHTRQ